MKKIIFAYLLMVQLIFTTSCKKENDGIIPTNTNPPPTPPAPVVSHNNPPKAYAGPDVYVAWPTDTALLKGYGFDPDSNIKSFAWKKISGSSLIKIVTADAATTKLRNLEKGNYELELTVTDSTGLVATDTVMVFVKEYSFVPQEIIFKDMQWSCPMGCWISVDEFYSFVPPGKTFKVFVKPTREDVWVEVLHESLWDGQARYSYGIYEGDLVVFATEEDVTKVDVKIVVEP